MRLVTKLVPLLGLILIMAMAAGFRLWGLKSIPPGLYIDEATNGNNALEALKTGPRVFYPENNGREGLFINLQALSVAIFGNEPWALRLVASLLGILTVLGMWLLAKELWQSHQAAFLASFLIAASFWHINFSRIGFRAISAPFFLVFGFYFLLKAFNSLKSNSKFYILNSIFSGLFFGLGFHSYIAYRVMPLAVAIILWGKWRVMEPRGRQRFKYACLYFLAAIFLAALPLGIYFLKNPADFWGRAVEVSILKKSAYDAARNVILTLGMFNVRGDWNWRHNFAGRPLLWWPVGILFLAGLAVSAKRLKRENAPLQALLPIAWLAVMLIPNLLSPEGSPHALRALVALPAVFLLAGEGAMWLNEFLAKRFSRRLVRALAAVFLGAHVLATWQLYFRQWAPNPAVAEAFGANYVAEARYLQSLPARQAKYVVVNFGWDDVIVRGLPSAAQTVIFLLGGWDDQKLRGDTLRFIREENLAMLQAPAGAVLVPLQKNEKTEELILKRWPKAKVLKFKYFSAYQI